MITSFGGKEYVSGESYSAADILAAYKQGLRNGEWEAEEKRKLEITLETKYHYDKGYEDGFEDGYNTAIKEMKSDKFNIGVCGSNVPNKETQEAMQEVLDKDSNEFEGIWVSKYHNPDWKIEYYSDCGTHVWMRVLGVPSLAAYVVGDLFTISKERLKSDYTKILEDNSFENTTEDDQLEKELELVEKYPHYYKDIRHLNIIDIYRFFDLFEVTDPCIQHSLKKLAVGGKRGAKDYEKDIKEAMDTLKRWEYMQEENKRGLDD